jgi:hypothetical protein
MFDANGGCCRLHARTGRKFPGQPGVRIEALKTTSPVALAL